MSLTGGGEVEVWSVCVRGCFHCGLAREESSCDVADLGRVGGADVCGVDYGGGEVVVESLALEEPSVAASAELVERFTVNEGEGGVEVVDAGGAAGLAAEAEASEQVA